jgi:cytochrome c biogenesis protein CcmG/thiol:disulfide interchange protein DsbE
MKRLLYLIPLIIGIVLFSYLGVALWRSAFKGDPHELPSALIDRPFPPIDLPPIAGREKGFATADLAGQVALVNVFASWCAPCKVEHPLLMAHAKASAIPIYGIAWKDDPAATADLLNEDGDPYRLVGADRSGRAAIDLGVTGVPETYVVDKAGRIRYKFARPVTEDDWSEILQPLMTKLAAE